MKKIRNWRANRNCPKTERTQIAQVGIPRPVPFPMAGATRIVQRTVCVGGSRKRFCSARSINKLTTFYAQATVADSSPPTAAIVQDNPFTQGAWTGAGSHSVSYTTSDNVGVKRAQVGVFKHDRPCDYTRTIPCYNNPGNIEVRTAELAEGTQPLVVRATDAADNTTDSQPVTVRIDRTAPCRPCRVGGAGRNVEVAELVQRRVAEP